MGKTRHFTKAGLAMCCVAISACAAPSQQPTITHLTGNGAAARAPSYPAEYQDSGGDGEVAAKCDFVGDGRVSNCSLIAVEGGKAFGQSVMAWLTGPNFRLTPEAMRKTKTPYHAFFIHMWGPRPPHFQDVPVAGGEPAVPAGQRQDAAQEYRHADCAIEPDGRPADCRILLDDPSDPFSVAAMAWLNNGAVRYRPAPADQPGARHLLTIRFHQKIT